MKALVFKFSWGRFTAAKALGLLSPGGYLSNLGPISYQDVPDPKLLGDDWVIVETALAGICGSDVKQVFLKGAIDNPLTTVITFPHVMGHEVVGTVVEVAPAVTRVKKGDRVVCNPWLSCAVRGLELCPSCTNGLPNLCQNFTQGAFAPGMHYGTCRDVSGAFAPLVPAHESMCHIIPESVSLEHAVLADPFAVALHAIMRAPPEPGSTVMVYGCGSIGMLLTQILGVLHPDVTIIGVDLHEFLREPMTAIGAETFLTLGPRDLINEIAERVGAEMHNPMSGLPWLQDGVDVVYDTVGSATTLETDLRIVKPRGRVVLVGVEPPARFEWTPLYMKEITLLGAAGCANEPLNGKTPHGFDVFLDMLANKKIDPNPVITHRFPIAKYRDAFVTAYDKKRHKSIKVLLEF